MSSRVVILTLGLLVLTPAIGLARGAGLDAMGVAGPVAGVYTGPPKVVSTSPLDNATGVPVAANLTIMFDGAMNATSVQAAFAMTPATAGDFTWNANATLARFQPRLEMWYGTQYEARLDGSVAKDVAGKLLDGNGDGTGGDDYAWRFTTQANAVPPRVVQVSPPANAINVSVTSDVELQFSEPVVRASVETAFSYTDGSTTWNGSAGSFSWGGQRFPDDSVRFDPYANFPFAAYVTVTLRAYAHDLAGLALDGNGNGRAEGSPTDDFVWMFRTESQDSTPPRVLAVDPPNGATGVMETTAIALSFSEAMDRTSVADAFALRDAVRNWTEADGVFSWGPGQDVVTYTPSGILSFDSDYHLSLEGTASDVNGNPLGIAFSSSFRTRLQPDTIPPRVVSTIPNDGQHAISRTPTISITFDDAMETAPTEAAITLAPDAPSPTGTIALKDFQWDGANHTVSFSPIPSLDWDAAYRVRVSQGARDDAGHALAASDSFGFRTEVWSGRVFGRIVDGDASVPGATVTLGNQTTQTTPNGTFAFPKVVAGMYNLTVTKAGYVPRHLTLSLDQRLAVPDAGLINLGVISLAREESGSPVFLEAAILIVVLGLVAVALYLRRRGGRMAASPEEFEDWTDEFAEVER